MIAILRALAVDEVKLNDFTGTWSSVKQVQAIPGCLTRRLDDTDQLFDPVRTEKMLTGH